MYIWLKDMPDTIPENVKAKVREVAKSYAVRKVGIEDCTTHMQFGGGIIHHVRAVFGSRIAIDKRRFTMKPGSYVIEIHESLRGTNTSVFLWIVKPDV